MVAVLRLDIGSSSLDAFEDFSKSLTHPDADKPITNALLPHLVNLHLDALAPTYEPYIHNDGAVQAVY